MTMPRVPPRSRRLAGLFFLLLPALWVLLVAFNCGASYELDATSGEALQAFLAERWEQDPLGALLGAPMHWVRHFWRRGVQDEQYYLAYADLIVGRRERLAALLKLRGGTGSLGGLADRPGPLLPYRDLACEYPPLGLLAILLPRLASADEFSYYVLFRLEMGLACVGALLLGLYVCGRLSCPPSPARLLLLSALAALALGQLFTTRLDPLAALFIMAALAAAAACRPLASGAMLALAAGAKLFPVLLAPLFLIWWRRDRGRAGHFALGLGGGLALIFLPPALGGGERFWDLFLWHSQRPLQLESLYANALLWHRLAGGPEQVVHSFGSHNLATPWDGLLRPLVGGVGVLAWAGLLALAWSRAPGRPAEEPPDRGGRASGTQGAVDGPGGEPRGLPAGGGVMGPPFRGAAWPQNRAPDGSGGEARGIFCALPLRDPIPWEASPPGGRVGPAPSLDWLVRATAVLLLGIMLFSKVLSPQYLIWLWPLIFLVGGRGSWPVQIAYVLACLASQLVFPVWHGRLLQLDPELVLLLTGRNLLLALALYGLVRPWLSNPSEAPAGWRRPHG
jgi:hypothetical protein